MPNHDDLLRQVAAGFANMTTAEIDAFIKNAKQTATQAKRANSKAARALEAKRLLLDGKLINFLLSQTTGEKIFLDAKTWAEKRDKFLTSNADRALFGLPPRPKDAPSKKRVSEPTKTTDEPAKTPEARPAAPTAQKAAAPAPNNAAEGQSAKSANAAPPPPQEKGPKPPSVSLDDFENP